MVKALTRLLRTKGFEVRGFTSAGEFLKAYHPQDNACLVLEVACRSWTGSNSSGV